MAPTEILIEQHLDSLQKVFSKYNIKIAVLTGRKKVVPKEFDIVIGTHALLFNSLHKQNLALIIPFDHYAGSFAGVFIHRSRKTYPIGDLLASETHQEPVPIFPSQRDKRKRSLHSNKTSRNSLKPNCREEM